MPTIVNLDDLWKSRHDLPENQMRHFDVARSGEVRIRLHLSRRGRWARHVDEDAETYVLLRGAMHFETDAGPIALQEGQIITFAPGEAHGGSTEDGALTMGFHQTSEP